MIPQSDEKISFTKEFTRQEPIPEAGIQRALELMQSGRLHRYNMAPGEISDVALLEKEYAEYVGSKYCLGLSSCGSSIHVALKSVGVLPGDKILCNAFTLAPVPGAIENAGAEPVFLEIKDDYLTDLDDLQNKAVQSGAKYFLLSHMRGHIVDMDRVTEIGVLIPDAQIPMFGSALVAIQDYIQDKNYSIMVGNTKYDNNIEMKLLKQFRQRNVAGIIKTGFDATHNILEESIRKDTYKYQKGKNNGCLFKKSNKNGRVKFRKNTRHR